MYFRICECCGAALDPGERCDCKRNKAVVLATSDLEV